MKYFRAELIFDDPQDEGDPQRHLPRDLRLIDPETDDRFTIPGVRNVSMSWGLNDVRVLKIELIVSGINEVVEPRR